MGKRLLFFLSLSLAVLISCENPFVRPESGLETQIQIELDGMPSVYNGAGRLIAYQTAYVVVEIYDGNNPTPMIKRTLNLVEENNRLFARGTIPPLPPKPQYLLVAKAFENNGTLWTEGSTNFKLASGGRQTISLKLSPTSSVIVNYPGALNTLQAIVLPARRTQIYKLTVPAPAYYTVDAFDFSTWNKPVLEASFNGTSYKEYTAFGAAHSIVGGMASPGQELIIALGNPSYFPVTYHVMVRQDGPSPPDGQVLTLNLNYTGSDLVVNDKVAVTIQFYPVPLVLGWSQTDPPPLFTKVVGQTGSVTVTELASFGRHQWAFRFVHDVNASGWLYGNAYSTNDILTWHRSDRADPFHMNSWTYVNSLAPDLLGTYPNKVDFDQPNAVVGLGQTVSVAWKENATKPGIAQDLYEPNNTFATATIVTYSGVPNHDGYLISSANFHLKSDVDWYQFAPLPYNDQYELRYFLSYPDGGPVRLELYKAPNLTTPVSILETSQPYENTNDVVFTGTAGETYYLKVLPAFDNLGTYKVELRLADENEEAGEVPYSRNIDLEHGWQTFRVSFSADDWFYFVNPYPAPIEFLAETDWPSSIYSRGNASNFPVNVDWPFLSAPTNKGNGPLLNGHPSMWGKLNSNSTQSIKLGTPVIPGRLVNLRVRAWRDVDEDNENAGTAKWFLTNGTNFYRSIHDPSDIDWYHVILTLKRTYRIRMQPSAINPSSSLPVKFEVTDTAGNPLFPPVVVLPDSSGMAFYEHTSNGAFKIRTEPANPSQTGVYTIRIDHRPDPNDRIAQWHFNGNLSPDIGPTLSGSGYQFVTGSQGLASTAIAFNPASDGKLVAASTPLPSAINTHLVFNLWIFIEPQSGTNFSRGWILAQEDASNNLRVGVEVYQIDPINVVVRIHLGAEYYEFSQNTNTWKHLAFSLDGYGAGSKVSFFEDQYGLGNEQYLTGDTLSSAPYTLRLGGRAAPGTTLNGVRIDNLKIYHMNSSWLINDYFGILEEPR